MLGAVSHKTAPPTPDQNEKLIKLYLLHHRAKAIRIFFKDW